MTKTAYGYDLEFLENGETIQLISIGIVSSTGREYYAVNADMPIEDIRHEPWLMQNVVPQLPLGKSVLYVGLGPRPFSLDRTNAAVKPRWVIRNEVREFLLAEGEPQLWADYGAYDHVALCQLWGRMIDLPEGLPMFTHDLQQALEQAPEFEKPQQESGEHNALEDARHLMRVLKALGVVTSE
ncbi:3'-5' exoribonuclease domain-containing protein [Nocardia asiatica]